MKSQTTNCYLSVSISFVHYKSDSGKIADSIFHLSNIIRNVNNDKWVILPMYIYRSSWSLACVMLHLMFSLCMGKFSCIEAATSMPIKIHIGSDSLIFPYKSSPHWRRSPSLPQFESKRRERNFCVYLTNILLLLCTKLFAKISTNSSSEQNVHGNWLFIKYGW